MSTHRVTLPRWPRPNCAGRGSTTSSPPRARCSTSVGCRMPRSRRSHARSASRAGSSTAMFSSKEELYVLTVTDYLRELDGVLEDGDRRRAATPPSSSSAGRGRYAGFCQRYPAFLDCALSLMRRPARELHDMVSESVWLRLGQGIAQLRAPRLAAARRRHATRASSTSRTPTTRRTCCGRRPSGRCTSRASASASSRWRPEIPALFAIEPERAIESCVAAALAAAGVRH